WHRRCGLKRRPFHSGERTKVHDVGGAVIIVNDEVEFSDHLSLFSINIRKPPEVTRSGHLYFLRFLRSAYRASRADFFSASVSLGAGFTATCSFADARSAFNCSNAARFSSRAAALFCSRASAASLRSAMTSALRGVFSFSCLSAAFLA